MKTIQKEKRIVGRKLEWEILYGIGDGWELCFRINRYAIDLQILCLYFYISWERI